LQNNPTGNKRLFCCFSLINNENKNAFVRKGGQILFFLFCFICFGLLALFFFFKKKKTSCFKKILSFQKIIYVSKKYLLFFKIVRFKKYVRRRHFLKGEFVGTTFLWISF